MKLKWCLRKVWRRRETAHDQKHNTSSVKYGGGNVVVWTCMARTRSQVVVTGDIMTSSLFLVKLGIISVLLKKTKAKNKTNLQLRLESDPIRIRLLTVTFLAIQV